MSNSSIGEAVASSTSSDCPDLPRSIFAGGGEMGDQMCALDWSKTPLGRVEDWPQSLKTTLSICLASRFPIVIYWGPEYVVLYNDAYSQILGSKHPWALGQTCRVCWAEIWDTIGPMLDGVLATGEATWSHDLLLMLQRFGYPEECYFSFSFSPVRVESGAVGGVFTAVIETTEKVIGERRVQTLRDLSARVVIAKTERDIWQIAAAVLAENSRDVPFAVLCETSGEELRVAATAGIDNVDQLCASLERPGSDLHGEAMRAMKSARTGELHNLNALAANLPTGQWETPPHSAMMLPIAAPGQGSSGLLLAAVSPAKKMDDTYRNFFDQVVRQITTGVADARAHEHDRRRAEELAELDRAKTVFFSNVSHEFRTPLTLMLGPLEDLLSHSAGEMTEEVRDQLAVIKRNATRLLKLVNTVLDFSRIEAGRTWADYQPTNLTELTVDVTSVFRSVMEKAGLRFKVECERVSEPAYVDREMWEKIVLNLLSNAFKFTFEGEVAVTLKQVDGLVELAVRDTGIGIAAADLPHIFERFHRVENSRARTYEGTGIGLALVQELARLHGGSVRVESTPGEGSTFTVTVRTGAAHLPNDRVGSRQTKAMHTPHAESHIEEALRWLPEEFEGQCDVPALSQYSKRDSASSASRVEAPARILIVDDNRDMREYLVRILSPAYEVHAIGDGAQAMEAAIRLHPMLILADIMMPGMDGVSLVRAVRDNPHLGGIPVILLSARAGEEARLEGLEHGADDYLVKPFTARELLARVASHVRMAKIRQEAAELEFRLRAEAEVERRRLRELLSSAPAAMGLLNGPEHRWTYVNDFYVRVAGRRNREDFVGKTVRESLPELEGQPFFDLLDRVYCSGESYTGTESLVRVNRGPNGQAEDVYFDFIYQPMRDAEGKVEGILVHAVDVTDKVQSRKLIEEAHERLRSSHIALQRLAAIVESSDDAIISKGLNGIVTSWNTGAEKMFGYKAEEMIGQPILKVIPPDLRHDEERILSTIARGERIDHFETVRMTKSGQPIEVSLTISPVRDESGRIVGASKIARDITQRNKTARIIHVTEKLASVGRLAATIAHEINNPLEAIANLVYLAKVNSSEEIIQNYLGQAEEELSRVSLLTRQTLGFYRETKGMRAVNLQTLIAPLVSVFLPRARNKSVAIDPVFRNAPEVQAVPGEIRQLVANLLSNSIDAVKADGRVQIRISAATERNGRGRTGARITVGDNGPGISADLRSHLYEPFFTTKRDVGTGLGLWVCKSIAEKHGGTISLKSSTEPGRSWTVFSVFLPLQPDKDAAEPELAPDFSLSGLSPA